MPIFEYECTKCGRRTEVIQRHDDPPPAKCPHCGGRLRKLFSAPSFQFKGSGFYATDYAGKKGGEPAESKPAASGDAPSPGAKTSDAKQPAPAKDSKPKPSVG